MIHRRNTRPRTVRRTINAALAAEAVGPIEHGCEVYGLTKGQFSLIELAEHCLDATGPADVVFSTWTAANADIAHAYTLLGGDAKIRSCRWLVDFSFPTRQPAYCDALRQAFGDACIAATANHAKFVSIRNDEWDLVIRTSMNLNRNARLESWEISDDAAMADALGELVDAAFDEWACTIKNAAKAPASAQRAVAVLTGPIEDRERVVRGSDHAQIVRGRVGAE